MSHSKKEVKNVFYKWIRNYNLYCAGVGIKYYILKDNIVEVYVNKTVMKPPHKSY